ncbi:MAG: 3-deoxy-manno-octulosonate cytidylyltransferase [Magnetospirillum sp.]|nr:3-deoxy-manno-octulosonate cytidylyltransferase [Magnetospirillum sp.]
MDVAIVIPARYGSSRLPGKPMAPVAGRSLLNRVWSIARAVNGVGAVYVATDDERVADHARGFGAEVVMTDATCENGTERAWQAMMRLSRKPDAVVNLQGDAVLTPPWVVQGLVDAFHADPGTSMVTAAVRCTWATYDELVKLKEVSPTSGTTVTMDRFGRALYFSKAIIPRLRKRDESRPPPVHRHIGIYGYTLSALERMATLPPSELEQAEQLEQLRALENGIPITVVPVDYRGRTHGSVDTPEDIAAVEAIIAREGELVP